MALSANSVWEVQTGGNDTNGGGFVTGAAGVDFSQVPGKRTGADVTDISTTDGVGNGTTTFTSATANFTTDIIGNIIYLQGGTGGLAAGRYQVTARASATNITLDRSVAAGTGITVNIGGAVLTLGILGSTTATALVAGNIIYIKAGTYTVTSATPNISNGCFAAAVVTFIEGYQTTRGDMGTKPLFQASGISTFIMIAQDVNGAHHVRNLKLDGAGLTSSKGLVTRGTAYEIEFVNFTNGACTGGSVNESTIFKCSATGCSTQPVFSNVNCIGCIAHSNTSTGFNSANSNQFVKCISYGNTGATSDGFTSSGTTETGLILNCVSYGNGRDGFRITSTRGGNIYNCIAESNTGTGFNLVNIDGISLHNCAYFGNGTNVSLGTGKFVFNYNSVLGTNTFFTNAAAGDFSLNNIAGGGADLRATAYPGVFPGGLTTGYLDIGAAQHQDSGGGGGGEHSSVF